MKEEILKIINKELKQAEIDYDAYPDTSTLVRLNTLQDISKKVSQMQLPVGVPKPNSESETLLECNRIDKYSIEPHGDGYAIYYGRCLHRHGYNLAHLTGCEEKFIQIIENALNEKSVKP